MKRISALALLIVASLSTTISALAQGPGVQAHIPFDFTVADTWMPAGDYLISSPENNVVRLRNADGTATATVVSLHSNHESNAGSELEFNKYGSRYFLTRVLCPTNSAMNLDVAHGKAEKTAHKLEAGLRGGEDILIAAK